MQSGYVAEPDKRFWVAACGVKIQTIGYAIGSLAATCREDGAHSRVLKRTVKVRKALFVGSSQISMSPKGVLAEIDLKPPAFENLGML